MAGKITRTRSLLTGYLVMERSWLWNAGLWGRALWFAARISSGLGYGRPARIQLPYGYSGLGIGPVGIWGFGVPAYLPLYRYNAIPAYARMPGSISYPGYRGYSYTSAPGYRTISPIIRPGLGTAYRAPASLPARSGGVGARGIGHRCSCPRGSCSGILPALTATARR